MKSLLFLNNMPNYARRSFIKQSMAVALVLKTGVATKAFAAEEYKLPAPQSDMFIDAVDNVKDVILKVSHDVWSNPELSLHEEISSKIHKDTLTSQGFKIVSSGTSGIPTAFVAEWSQGNGGPKIGYLPEYDALPGLKNAAEPMRDTNDAESNLPGHGCGHNMLGAACTGAAIALKNIMQKNNINGTVRVYGCAAEETEGAKVYMAREGLFNDLDACLAWHPAPMTGTGLLKTSAVNMFRIKFHGKTAHAGVAPWEGRSALKGAELFGIGVQFMREQLSPTTRLHYIYTNAGETPNVIPDYAEVFLMVRGASRAEVETVSRWVTDTARGAALQTQTKEEIEHFFGLHDLLPNDLLVNRIYQHITSLPVQWTEEEQLFAKKCQAEMGVKEAGLMTSPVPLLPEMTTGGSTDVGDVSYNCPVGLFAWTTMPAGIGLHTWPVTACAGMSIGDKGTLNAAKVMTGIGYDVLVNEEFRDQVRRNFEKRKGNYKYKSPLPEGKIQPDAIPAHLLIRDGSGELTDEYYQNSQSINK
ncbi:TPA: amidohydrolase [Klebsiella quasipneumoniae subsp. similipneumoniae]|nr:amidohydrolase [Klebsiella quasipneumoniae subsp. similipneumoniae]HCI6805191.1 amidohydrolase [Klebsiella quasipneumoniae subsp. similipneumoniae]